LGRDVNLRQLDAFRAVMNAGSVVGAARALFVSQPAVSRLIADFEQATGLRLFARSGNRLQATSEADMLYREVQRAYFGIEEVKRCATALVHRKAGHLRIGCPSAYATSVLLDPLEAFAHEYPSVDVTISIGNNRAIEGWVNSRLVDVGVIRDASRLPGMETVALSDEPAVCVVPRGNALARKSAVRAEDMQGQAYISLASESRVRQTIDAAVADVDFARRFVIETQNAALLYDMVRRGMGIAIVNPFVARKQVSDEFVIRPFLPRIRYKSSVIRLLDTPLSLVAAAFYRKLIDLGGNLAGEMKNRTRNEIA